MKKNMGSTDRLVRSLIAVVVAALYMTNVISGTLGLVLLVAAAVFLLTSLVSICPLYSLFGFKTCPARKMV